MNGIERLAIDTELDKLYRRMNQLDAEHEVLKGILLHIKAERDRLYDQVLELETGRRSA